MQLLRGNAESFNGYVSEVANTMKFRFLGLGFLWAWIYATWFTPTLFPASTGLTVRNDLSWSISAGVVALTLFVMPLLLRDRELSTVPFIPKIAGPLTSIGAALMASSALFGIDSAALSLVGAAVTGVASGWLWMLWGEFTGKVDQELTELFVPLCIAVPAITLFSTIFITGPVAGIAVCLLPTVSNILLLLSLNDEEVVHPVELLPVDERPRYMGNFVRIGLGSMALFTCIGFTWGMLEYNQVVAYGGTHLLPYVLGAVAAIIISVLMISYSSHLDLFSLYRGLVPVALFGLLFLAVQSPWGKSIALALITCAQYMFDVIIWIYFSRVVRCGVCSGGVAIGINRGFIQVGVMLGTILAMYTPTLIAEGHLSLPFVAFALSVVTTTIVLLMLSKTDDFEKIMGREPSMQAKVGGVTDYDRMCTELAEEHDLTPREREILGYLARGRSLPYIRETLVLSKNTVGTHVRNIYRKLGIHSKQDLLDLFENDGL